jgi:hypothetical protein
MLKIDFLLVFVEKFCFYNNEEKTDMFLIYGEYGKNSVAAADIYKPMVDS